MRSRIIWTMFMSGVVLIAIGMMNFSLTTLQQPGPLETRIANLAKHVVIRLASRHGIPAPPVNIRASIEAGGAYYGLDCGICHGVDGRSQTPSGQWMYHAPRISPVSEYRATPIKNCFGSSTMASGSRECLVSAKL